MNHRIRKRSLMSKRGDSEEIFGLGSMSEFKKAMGKCRNCGHVRMGHFQGARPIICLDAKLLATGRYERCDCSNYEPEDNLEYLEYKYDKKKLGKGK